LKIKVSAILNLQLACLVDPPESPTGNPHWQQHKLPEEQSKKVHALVILQKHQ